MLGYSQSGTISGKIVSEEGPVEFANVILKGTTNGSFTNADGKFLIQNVPAGDYTILISLLGYTSVSEEISLSPGQNLKMDFTIRPDAFNLENVVVSGTRYEQDRVNNPIVVNMLDDKIFKATQSITVSESLNYQPGVRVEANCQNCGFTQVRLNGLDGAYSQILINSRAIFSALNSVYGLEQIPTNIVERVEVVRSGGSALYGSNAIGGTINIITKDPVENLWEIQSNTGVFDDGGVDQTFSMNGSIVNESLTSGVTFYGMSRNRDSYDADGDGFTELVELNNTVFGGKAFFKPSDRSKISVDFSALEEYRRGGDRLNLAPHFTDIAEQLDHNTFFGGLNFEQRTKDNRGQFAAYASAQSTRRDSYYGGLGGGRTAEDSLLAINSYGITDDVSFVIGTQFNYAINNRDVFTIGVENQNYDTQDEINGYNRLVDQRVNSTGIFGQYEWKPSERLTTLIGGRYDITDVDGTYRLGDIDRSIDQNFGVFSPRFTLMYKITEDLRFRGGYARGFRAPQAFNEDLHISSVGGEPLFVILSEDLEKETSNAYTGSFNYTKNVGLTQFNFLLEGFYTRLQNPFTQVSTGVTLPNGSIVEEVRNGEGATVSGINFESGFSPNSNLAFQLGGTIQSSKYDEPQVLFEPEDGGENAVVVDEFVRNPNFYGYFTSYYSFSKRFRVDLTGTYTGSMIVPRVVGDDGFLDLFESDPFFDVNLKASYHVDLSEDFQVEFSGGIRNMFNSFQPEFSTGPERDSDFVYGPLAPRSFFFAIKIGRLH